jgi:hypothetical protein
LGECGADPRYKPEPNTRQYLERDAHAAPLSGGDDIAGSLQKL